MSRTHRVATTLVAATLGCALAPAAGAAPVSTGHSPWGWGSPVPQGQDLAAVAFQGADGYAVGAFGTILASDDAGQTWSGLPSPTTTDLDLVQEIDPTTVVAAGGCTVLESTDSGANFAALPIETGPAASGCPNPVAGVSFLDATQGFVELQDGTLVYTDDGGASLQARTSPPLGVSPVGVAHAAGIAFLTPQIGLAISSAGLIERTTDGGNSWAQVDDLPFDGLDRVAIVSPTLAYVVGSDGTLLRSTDAGATWTALPLSLEGGGAAPDLTSITCADANDCLMTTADSNEVVRTADGGMTGTLVSVSENALTGVAYTTGATVVGVGGQGSTVISQDGGQTFPIVASGGVSTAGTAPVAPPVAGLAPGSAYALNASGIAATTDSGRSWSQLRVPTTAGLRAVTFTSASTGYVLDSAGILRRTADGGTSWRSYPGEHRSARGLAAPRAGTLVMIGRRGILRSTDGGGSFAPVSGRLRLPGGHGPKIASLRESSILASHGALVAWPAAGGPIVSSADGGRTWRAIPLPGAVRRSPSKSVSAVSAARLWVDADGALYATADAGRHWTRLAALGALPIPASGRRAARGQVSFASPQDGVVALRVPGAAAAAPVSVLQTTDGGRSWKPEVVAGPPSPVDSVLATPTGDLAVLATQSTAVPVGDGYLTTAGSPVPGRRTQLRVGFSPARISVRALARAGHRVVIAGRLGPVLSPAETVTLSTRVNGGQWHATQVPVASAGTFRVTLGHVRTGAQVVAQAVGTSTIAGAGTPVSTLTVSR